jgi:hypothetical protein
LKTPGPQKSPVFNIKKACDPTDKGSDSYKLNSNFRAAWRAANQIQQPPSFAGKGRDTPQPWPELSIGRLLICAAKVRRSVGKRKAATMATVIEAVFQTGSTTTATAIAMGCPAVMAASP